ncbi:MAG TPA: OmpH family outer membrane protein [Ignavibacteriaceae bacterium]|nr:OmpH family outer membrane protein [Ignavibacteriaceae bacterium]
MKKLFFPFAIAFLLFSGFSPAQLKIGYVDSKTILDRLPDAQDARQKLDAFIRNWKDELSKMQANLTSKKDDFERRKLIMTEQTRKEATDEIENLQKEIDNFRNKKFGERGELYQKQDELMKPIQNKVFTVIKEIALEEDLDFVFDRSSDVTLLYAKDEYDITASVMEKLKLN